MRSIARTGWTRRTHRIGMTLSIPVVAALPLLARAAVVSGQADDWTSLTSTLEKAALAGTMPVVKDQRVAALRELAKAPTGGRAPLIRYTIAYADWRMAFAPTIPAQEQSDFVADGVEHLGAAIAAQPDFADAMGLLAALEGAQIAKNPDLGMTLGPEFSALLGRALRLEPANPRLLVIQGQSLFHTPVEYGGSPKEAEVCFRRALDAFAKEPASRTWPNWGRFDAHAWLGQMLAARGDKAGARSEYAAALEIAPDSRWVRDTLLPQVVK
jgi:tetratricopeptide (TPR) repeat protein